MINNSIFINTLTNINKFHNLVLTIPLTKFKYILNKEFQQKNNFEVKIKITYDEIKKLIEKNKKHTSLNIVNNNEYYMCDNYNLNKTIKYFFGYYNIIFNFTIKEINNEYVICNKMILYKYEFIKILNYNDYINLNLSNQSNIFSNNVLEYLYNENKKNLNYKNNKIKLHEQSNINKFINTFYNIVDILYKNENIYLIKLLNEDNQNEYIYIFILIINSNIVNYFFINNLTNIYYKPINEINKINNLKEILSNLKNDFISNIELKKILEIDIKKYLDNYKSNKYINKIRLGNLSFNIFNNCYDEVCNNCLLINYELNNSKLNNIEIEYDSLESSIDESNICYICNKYSNNIHICNTYHKPICINCILYKKDIISKKLCSKCNNYKSSNNNFLDCIISDL
jgi:hypothetical protein